MDQSTLLLVLTFFVAISAVALVIQAASLLGLYLVGKKIQGIVASVMPQVNEIVRIGKRTAESTERHVGEIGASSVAILGITKQQLVKVDELLSDASTRAKVQMERAEMVIDDTMTRVQGTVSIVQKTVLRPIREVHGILSGLRATFAHLSRGGRPTVDHATADEEMFI